jgi:putative chitinase
MITGEQFAHLFPRAQDPNSWANSMNNVFPTYEINTPQRIAAFVAQCGHESGGWTVFEENLNYSSKGLLGIFPKYFTASTAESYARKPEKIASKVYGGRMGNGVESTGEGYKFRGRGYIQLTGKSNYTKFGKFIGEDTIGNPDLVASKYPLASAAFFFDSNNIGFI